MIGAFEEPGSVMYLMIILCVLIIVGVSAGTNVDLPNADVPEDAHIGLSASLVLMIYMLIGMAVAGKFTGILFTKDTRVPRLIDVLVAMSSPVGVPLLVLGLIQYGRDGGIAKLVVGAVLTCVLVPQVFVIRARYVADRNQERIA